MTDLKRKPPNTTESIREAEAVVCNRTPITEPPVPPVGYGTCYRCDHEVYFRDVYPPAMPKVCVDCINHEMEHGLN
jgi:hypothetical protein